MPRYVDADWLLERAVPIGWSTPKWVSDIVIEDAPTADVPERKVGKWVLIGSRLESRPYACSKCNYAFQVDTVMGKTAWNYCPNCGAEMKGEEDDTE